MGVAGTIVHEGFEQDLIGAKLALGGLQYAAAVGSDVASDGTQDSDVTSDGTQDPKVGAQAPNAAAQDSKAGPQDPKAGAQADDAKGEA